MSKVLVLYYSPTAISRQWRQSSPRGLGKPAPRSTSNAFPSSYRTRSRATRTTRSLRPLPSRRSTTLPLTTRSSLALARLSSQMTNFLDQVGGLWARGALHGKVGGAFTSTATQHGGQETTLFSIITNLLHFGMVIVGLDYGHAGQKTSTLT